MAEVPLLLTADKRDKGNFPRLVAQNVYAEQAKASANQIALFGREALVTVEDWGAGPVRKTYQQEGLFGGDMFAVIGKTFYRDGVAIGQINGTGPVSIASSQVEIVIAAGRDAFSYRYTDGAHDFAKIALPDSFRCRGVTYLGALFVFARATLATGDSSHRYYWSAPIDARSVDDLDFASAESSPDGLADIATMGDNLVLAGDSSIEFWMLTGNTTLPFSRISQRIFKKGLKQTGAHAEFDNTWFFVGNNNTVYRVGEVPQRLSDHSIEERIGRSNDVKVFTFQYEGHEFFAVRLGGVDETWVTDAAMPGQWYQWTTLGRDNFRAQCCSMVDGVPVFGDDTDGKLLRFSGFAEDGVALERILSIAIPLSTTTVIDSLTLEVNAGWTETYSGEGRDPVIEMRSSRDGGRTWSVWRGISLGERGEFRKRVTWRRLGYFDNPGMLVQVRLTDPAPLRVTRAFINEMVGGRAR